MDVWKIGYDAKRIVKRDFCKVPLTQKEPLLITNKLRFLKLSCGGVLQRSRCAECGLASHLSDGRDFCIPLMLRGFWSPYRGSHTERIASGSMYRILFGRSRRSGLSLRTS